MNTNWNDAQILDNYIINAQTMAILPHFDSNQPVAKIIEFQKVVYVNTRTTQVIDKSCRYYGASFQGRKTGTKELIGITHKPPIVIDPANTIYFFPTNSPAKPQCAWLSHAHISGFKKEAHDQTIVTFHNNESIKLDISFTSFRNQFYRTAQLRTVVSSRMEEEKRKMDFLLFPDGSKALLYEQIVRELRKGMKEC
ncbi:competence protein ComK [Bacillus sp. FJAT-47783]|uniref:competence protein ComK n=1 Tax=Bacillus sp. FJAT-47783 TaxID=2922712 RepID=UPI001FACF351|nr:competence protein ComK [Bacillus sp. FJAT-47783]